MRTRSHYEDTISEEKITQSSIRATRAEKNNQSRQGTDGKYFKISKNTGDIPFSVFIGYFLDYFIGRSGIDFFSFQNNCGSN
jgi:F0F1-type ATP synthase assembly protein I